MKNLISQTTTEMSNVATESQSTPLPNHIQDEWNTFQIESNIVPNSTVNSSSSSDQRPTMPTSRSAVTVAKVTRSSRLSEGSYNNSDAFPYAKVAAADIDSVKPSYREKNSTLFSGKEDVDLSTKEPEENVRVDSCNDQGRSRTRETIILKHSASHPPKLLNQANGSLSTTNDFAHDPSQWQQRRESDSTVGSLPHHTFIESQTKPLPQCQSRTPKLPRNHNMASAGCFDNSSHLDPCFSSWSDTIEHSVAEHLFGVGNQQDSLAVHHWADKVRIFYGSLALLSPAACRDVSTTMDEIVSNWCNLYYTKYFSIPNPFHGRQMHNNRPYHSSSKSDSASVCSVCSGSGKPSEELAASCYFFNALFTQILWNEVCERCLATDSKSDALYDTLTEFSKILSFHDVMNILIKKVKILSKTDPPNSGGQEHDGAITEGMLYYFPNEKCVAFGEMCWNTWACTKLSIKSNIWENPHFLMISACTGSLTPLDLHSRDSSFDVLLSPWIFQIPSSPPIKNTELYAIQLLPFHCINCVLNESFWQKEESFCHFNFVLRKTAQLLLENDFFFAGRINSTLKHHITSNAEMYENINTDCRQKIIEVIQLHIKDCEAWSRLRCENTVSLIDTSDRGFEDIEQNCLFYSEKIKILMSGYKLFLSCLVRWSIEVDVNLGQDKEYQNFYQSFNGAQEIQTDAVAFISTKIPRNSVLHICGQAAHLFGQSLDNLRTKGSYIGKKLLQHTREFYIAALRFYELIVARPFTNHGDDDIYGLQESGGEDRSLSSERSLILIHLANNEENTLDYMNAIGHYKEALAILRNPALWRYNLPLLSGSHWGDDNDDDESLNSNDDCRSELSGSIASSHSAALNLTHLSHVSLALHHMGICYLNTGEYKMAADCLSQAVELRKKELIDPAGIVNPLNHHNSITRRQREADLADSLLWLATAHREENKPDKAYEILRDCLIVKLLLFGKSHIEVANVQFNMGIILGDLSRHEESLKCYREALYVQRHFANEQDIVNNLLCQGNVFLRVLADNPKALECFVEALQLLEKVVGLESVTVIVDEAKCLGCVEASHIFHDPEIEGWKRAKRRENNYNYDRMIQYYTISFDIISNHEMDFMDLGPFFKTAYLSGSHFKDRLITCEIFILEGLSKVYMAQMKWKPALETLQKKLKVLRRCWEENSDNRGSFDEKELIDKEYEKTLYNLAHMLFKLRRFQQAEQCYTDILEARKAKSKADASTMACGIADALHNKGSCLKEMNLLNDAIRCYEESISWREGANYADNCLEISLLKANTFYHLGSAHLLQNEWEKAEAMFGQCMKVYKMDGNRTLSEAFVLQSIGKIHHLNKDLSAALDCYSKCLQIYRDAVGHDEDIDQALAKELAVFIAEAFHNIGVIYDTQKKYSMALVNYEDALKLYRAKYKSGHCMIATTLNNMGLVLMQQQCFSEALKLFEEALQVRKEKLGEHHADVGQVWHNMGLVHEKLALRNGHSSLFHAIDCFKQALRIQLPIYGEINLEMSNTWNSLGIAYKSLNDYDNAIGCFIKVVRIREELLGCDHVEVANANHNLGNLYAKTGNFSKALEAYEASYKIRLHAYGQNHFSVASTLHNQGNVYYRMGDKERARKLYEEALKIRDSNSSSVENNNKADLANSLHKVAQLEMECGQYDIALAHFERALGLKRLVYGDTHIYLASTLKAVSFFSSL